AERPHAGAGLSGANQQRQLDEVAIEVTDLVTGLERRGITGAGRDRETRGRLGPGCGARRRLAPTKSFHLEEARVGDQRAAAAAPGPGHDVASHLVLVSRCLEADGGGGSRPGHPAYGPWRWPCCWSRRRSGAGTRSGRCGPRFRCVASRRRRGRSETRSPTLL